MSQAPILDVQPDGTVVRYHEEGSKIILAHEHPDLERLQRANAEMRNTRSRLDKKGDLHHVMRVPQAIITKICIDTGLDFFNPEDAKEILKILKRPEYAQFRTYSGQI